MCLTLLCVAVVLRLFVCVHSVGKASTHLPALAILEYTPVCAPAVELALLSATQRATAFA